MIKCHLSKEKNISDIEVGGNALYLINEMVCIINHMHKAAFMTSPEAAAAMKTTLQKVVADDSGPCWKNPAPGDEKLQIKKVKIRFPWQKEKD